MGKLPFVLNLTLGISTQEDYAKHAASIFERLKQHNVTVVSYVTDGLPYQVAALRLPYPQQDMAEQNLIKEISQNEELENYVKYIQQEFEQKEFDMKKDNNSSESEHRALAFHFACWAHLVRLAFQHAAKSNEILSQMLDTVSIIATFLRKMPNQWKQINGICPRGKNVNVTRAWKRPCDQLPAFIPNDLKELIESMIDADYFKRPTTKQIMSHSTIDQQFRMQLEKEKGFEVAQNKAKVQQQPLSSSIRVVSVPTADEQVYQSYTAQPDPLYLQAVQQQHAYYQAKIPKQNKIQTISSIPVLDTVSSNSLQYSEEIPFGPIVHVHLLPHPDAVQIDGELYKNKLYQSTVVLFDSVIRKGIVKFKVDDDNHLHGIGIADESIRYSQDEEPFARGEDKVLEYRSFGSIKHIGESIDGNRNFYGYPTTLELNMDTDPRTLTFFVQDEEQPNFVYNIPAAVRFWCLRDIPSISAGLVQQIVIRSEVNLVYSSMFDKFRFNPFSLQQSNSIPKFHVSSYFGLITISAEIAILVNWSMWLSFKSMSNVSESIEESPQRNLSAELAEVFTEVNQTSTSVIMMCRFIVNKSSIQY
ncbi:MAG: hypothetical protein EZS28_006241 [Streblomastix strix]|uniref:Uncharacterized protein n=1 Tax=Streblomastix strix TaxID=222440 RepID=A0A5J4WT49_9EUKA|nr:MAG: hypothetical protein EZS28_006241 [Streblomastix strix]